MKIEYKTILAIFGVILLFCVALSMPVLVNGFIDQRSIGQTKRIDNGNVYEINTNGVMMEKLKMLSEFENGENEEYIFQVPLYLTQKKLERIQQRIEEEYFHWTENLELCVLFDKQQFLHVDELKFSEMYLYTIYGTNISFYKCNAIGVDIEQQEKYHIKIYIDSSDYKIYGIRVANNSTTEWLNGQISDNFKEGTDIINVTIEDELYTFLSEYYEIDNKARKDFEAGGIFTAKIYDNVKWCIAMDGWFEGNLGIFIGINAITWEKETMTVISHSDAYGW